MKSMAKLLDLGSIYSSKLIIRCYVDLMQRFTSRFCILKRYVSYAILRVKSPELEKLLLKYGLKPKLQFFEFHITIAKKTVRRKIIP